MKTLFSFLLCLTLSVAAFAHTPAGGGAEVEVIITPGRILLIGDELPVKSLGVRVIDGMQRVVLEKAFTSKQTDWSIDVSELPAGTYTVCVGEQAPVPFVKTSGGLNRAAL